MEEWKDIDGYEGIYQVSNEGRVKSVERVVKSPVGEHGYMPRHEHMLKASRHNQGYMQVCLSRDGDSRNFYVHRLVAKAFIPNERNLEEINHIDGNKANNKASNLEWCTRTENICHSLKNGLHYRRKVIRSDGAIFDSVKEAAKASGLVLEQCQSDW